jgi:2-polyprenyl-6-methoxyphenol hydroxylase-like FAD-dependent oxidoreductase
VFPVEGDRWLVNVHGVHGDHPPTDLDGMGEFAETLPVEHLGRFLRENRVVGDVEYYPFPSNRRRYYERVDRFPDGLVVVGDAMTSFNPVYGQGMSVAALEALQLHHALVDGLDGLAARYFDRAASVVDTAWAMAVGADAQFAETTGPTPRGASLFARYLSRLQRRAHDDPDLRVALMRVISMELPPTTLFRPRVLARVLAPIGLGSGRGGRLSPIDSGPASSTRTADRLPGIEAEDHER